jgi:hypothetical protein
MTGPHAPGGLGIDCPNCGSHRIVHERGLDAYRSRRRRRRCRACGSAFWTIEISATMLASIWRPLALSITTESSLPFTYALEREPE